MPNSDFQNRRPKRITAVILIVLLALVFSLIIFGLGQLNPTGIADLLAALFNRRDNNTQEGIDPDYAAILDQLTATPPTPPTNICTPSPTPTAPAAPPAPSP